MSPTDYAQSAIGGSTASEALQLISLDIKKECENFRHQTGPFLVPERNLENTFVKSRLADLKRDFARSHSELLRISALLKLASEQLDIPVHRLRELLVEYDPAMHRAHARKFVQNLELFLSVPDLNTEHKKKLLEENVRIVTRADKRIQAQTDMLEYTALHSSILRMAALHSTAQATQEYARVISDVAERTYKQTPDTNHVWDTDARDRLADGMAALLFIARRQRAHSGADLNETCLNMTRIPCDRAELKKQQKALQDLGQSIHRENRGGSFRTNVRDVPQAQCMSIREVIGHLRNIYTYTVKRIEEDRGRIAGVIEDNKTRQEGSFERMYKGWRKENPGRVLLVTHGFSTTVREVFKRALPEMREPGIDADQQILPDIFVIGSGEASDLDSRLMVSALLETEESERRFRWVAAGDKDTLAKLVEKDLNVMVVLGAECFDKKGRVLHPWGLEDRDKKWIRRGLGGKAFRVVVVAEGYKFHEDLLASPHLFRYHLDRLQLYDPRLIDIFVTTDIVSGIPDQPRYDEHRTRDRDMQIIRRPQLSAGQGGPVISPEFNLIIAA